MFEPLKVVLLVLTLWDADTGVKLYEVEEIRPMWSIQGEQDHIETCRKYGVTRAHALTQAARAEGHHNAFTNVDCHWVDKPRGESL